MSSETVSHRKAAKILGVTPKTVYRMVKRGALETVTGDDGVNRILRSSLDKGQTVDTADQMERLMGLLEDAGVSPEEVGSVEKIKSSRWQGISQGEVVDLKATSVVLSPKWEAGPEYPLIQPAPITTYLNPAIPRPRRKTKTAVVLPDPQFGYRRDRITGELDPFHDVKAIDVALQITRDLEPDLIVNLGDLMDFPEFGRYKQEPAFQATTQPAINEAHNYISMQRSMTDGDIVVFEGNHDRRLEDKIVDHAAAAFGIQRANVPDEWPVLSLPFLLHFEELDIQYLPGYPANVYWINDRLACVHGSKVRSNGSTACAEVDDERASVIFGHIHRIELQHKTRNVRDGFRTNLAASPGCLCRIDGAVPSTKGSTDSFGRPLVRYENWQQGIAVVTYEEGDGPFGVELVPIHSGTAIFRGETYVAEAK